MKRLCLCANVCLLLCATVHQVTAQAELPKLEGGAHFTLLNVDRASGNVNELGIGARITFNPSRLFGLEGEINFFPKRRNNAASNQDGGRITQGLFGAKLGFRTERFGVFGKLRPGFQSFGRVITSVTNTPSSFEFEYGRLTHFALDAGGVVEFYPSRRTLVRFDLGDTITRHGSQVSSGTTPVIIPAHIHHNLQLSLGAGIRF